MNVLWQDLRFGLRMLVKSPGFTAVAVLSLALGIGANTAIFSLVNAVLLRPLPFSDPDRLVMVWEDAGWIGFPRNTPAVANYVDWKTQNHVFEDMSALSWRSFNLIGDGDPEKIDAQAVSANFFSLLGVKPILGRTFLQEEDQPGANKVALVSYSLWQQRLGSDPNPVGRELLLDGQKYSVIGVMPRDFQFLGRDVNLWVPIAFSNAEWANRGSHYLTVFARLKPGVSVQQANSDIVTITQRIAQDHPREASNLKAFVLPLREQLAGRVSRALIVLLVAVACVLLIACANIANLTLARAAARNKEIALRTALGAGRWRIIRQLLTESVLLAGVGAAFGLLLGYWSLAFLKKMVPDQMAAITNLEINPQVLIYTLLISLAAGVLFGLAPAWQATRLDLNEALKQGGRSGSVRNSGLRRVFVVAEVALALMLLIGAGLMIRTMIRLQGLEIGFEPENVLTMRTSMPRQKYAELPKRAAFYQQVLERVKTLPGVTAAAYTTSPPLVWRGGTNGISVEGRPPAAMDSNHRQISPDYFRAMGIPLREGRLFNEYDKPDTQSVAIINETMARQFWGGEPALGKRFKIGGYDSPRPWTTVVGIVGDVRQMGLDVPIKAEMYFPAQQIDMFWASPTYLVVKTASDPTGFVAGLRREVWAIDKDQPISNVKLMDEILADEVSSRQMQMVLFAAFAALALLLASLGIYGVLSYNVTQRTSEIGIRLALGAQPRDVWRMVASDGMRLATLGIGIGLGAAFALTRVMASLLFNVSATDPMTFVAVPLVLFGVSLFACYLPARRATKVDPLVALRYE
jgi:putative ABC transport system permease protein